MEDLRRIHRARGFRDIGYHYVVFPDGEVRQGRKLEEIGAHALGHNNHSIGVAYVGGIGKDGKPADTRTDCQKAAMFELLKTLSAKFHAPIVGHRDLLKWNDKNLNGVRDLGECLKDCPCFDAKSEYEMLYALK